jgi:hypothetical protein
MRRASADPESTVHRGRSRNRSHYLDGVCFMPTTGFGIAAVGTIRCAYLVPFPHDPWSARALISRECVELSGVGYNRHGSGGAGRWPASRCRCEGAPPMTASTTNDGAEVAVVRRFIDEVINGGQLDLVDELWSKDLDWHGGSLGEIHGLASYKAFLRAAAEGAFSGMHLTVSGCSRARLRLRPDCL